MINIINKSRTQIADVLQHFVWALGGTECECGSNPFNKFARWMDKRVNADDQWDEDGNAIGRWSRLIDRPYSHLSRLAMWIDPS